MKQVFWKRHGFSVAAVGCAFVLLLSCAQREEKLSEAAHQQEVDAWFEDRIRNLKDTTGWLNLVGLYWLQEGINTFGSAETNQVVFPVGTIAADAGYFLVKNGVVTMNVNTGVPITSRGAAVTSMVVFHPDSARLPHVEHGSLQWFIIQRDNQVGVRLRDLNSAAVTRFKGIERYPVDLQWRVEAAFEPTEGKTIDITNVLGQTVPTPSPGVLTFQIGGKKYSIDALEGGDELFLIFADDTNGKETYPAGRYLYVKKPGADNKVVIDFNKAYNPPCAFTPFATCPLPPRQNVLALAVTAGEKNYEENKH